jgi:hypothetical protein
MEIRQESPAAPGFLRFATKLLQKSRIENYPAPRDFTGARDAYATPRAYDLREGDDARNCK